MHCLHYYHYSSRLVAASILRNHQLIMARAQKGQKAQKAGKSNNLSRKSANALGYAKRRSLKTQSTSKNISDVYEYQQEKTRRSKVKLQLSRDERMEFGAGEDGSGSEEDDDDLARATDRRPRLIGEAEDDEMIDEEDDEEIDSDAAFEEDDEERFAGFTFASDVSLSSNLTLRHELIVT